MAEGIYTIDDQVITDHIRDAIPGKRGSKNVNRLFDGTWHVQTYGEASPKLRLTAYADITALKRLNDATADGELIKVNALGQDWIGAVEEDQINWSESAPGYYRGGITLILIDPEELL